ncbi:MAG TPA: HAD family hydrolase [Candidatus Udaeobacter sp.]|nr:HAD family hydrolase [Candidatus Udaeobacter sp.]
MFDFAFVDWDNTVYDTEMFKNDILNIFSKYGASVEDIKKTFRQSLCTISPDQYDYSFPEHISFLRELGYKLPESIEAELNTLFVKDYIFPEAQSFLQFLKQVSEKVMLLSAGDYDFQLRKIKASKIYNNFDDVIIISGGKPKYLVGNFVGNKIFFVNDNLKENKSVKTEIPAALVVTKLNIKRDSEVEAAKIGVPYFTNLTDIQNYVAQQIK